MTAWCWGFGWSDDVIDPKTRSMMNLTMIGALGKMHEWEVHCKGAISNGVTEDELRAIIHVIGFTAASPRHSNAFVRRAVPWRRRGWSKGPALSHTPLYPLRPCRRFPDSRPSKSQPLQTRELGRWRNAWTQHLAHPGAGQQHEVFRM